MFVNTFISKTTASTYVFKKVPSATIPNKLNKHILFLSTSGLHMYFTIKTQIFKLRPRCRFLCVINSFYKRSVLCMYNTSKISPIYVFIQYILSLDHIFWVCFCHFLCRHSSFHRRKFTSNTDLTIIWVYIQCVARFPPPCHFLTSLRPWFLYNDWYAANSRSCFQHFFEAMLPRTPENKIAKN